MKTKQTRRDFLATAATGAVAAVVVPTAFAAEKTELTAPTILPQQARGANDRIRIAVLGLNGRGTSHVQTAMGLADEANVTVVALCDPDMRVLQKRAKEFEDKYKQKILIQQDFRKLYESKDIDAVTLATPNHWHALHTIYACQAGKDVYVEKPATHEIAEGRKIIEAAYKYNRIVQHGIQLRSNPAVREAVKHLRDGLIGNVYMSRGLVFRERADIGNKGISKVPPELDYDLWCGPAPMAPFTENLVHYNWHWHWNYGNGDVGNQGIHETDLCMWGLGVDTLPNRVTSMGGKFLWKDCKEVPEVQSSSYLYTKENKMIQFEVRPWYTNSEGGATVGNIFYGDKGYLVVNGYNAYESFIYKNRSSAAVDTSSGNLPSRGELQPGPKNSAKGEMELHFKNWFDAIRARDKTIQNGPVETGHLSSALAHMAAISYRLGQQLEFDPVAERFIGNQDANNMLTRQYRAPFLMPDKI